MALFVIGMLAVLIIWLIMLLILLRILYWVLKSIILIVPRARAARQRAEKAALREKQKPREDYMSH